MCYVLLDYVGKKETAVTVDAEFLMKLLGNQEMAALLTSLAKSLKVELNNEDKIESAGIRRNPDVGGLFCSGK